MTVFAASSVPSDDLIRNARVRRGSKSAARPPLSSLVLPLSLCLRASSCPTRTPLNVVDSPACREQQIFDLI